MTPTTTVPAIPVLNLTDWSRKEVEHASRDAAWDAVMADAASLLGKEVYIEEIETGECSTISFPRPVKARVTFYETDPTRLNVNDSGPFYYIDPYVNVELLETGFPEGARFTYGRSHRFPRRSP